MRAVETSQRAPDPIVDDRLGKLEAGQEDLLRDLSTARCDIEDAKETSRLETERLDTVVTMAGATSALVPRVTKLERQSDLNEATAESACRMHETTKQLAEKTSRELQYTKNDFCLLIDGLRNEVVPLLDSSNAKTKHDVLFLWKHVKSLLTQTWPDWRFMFAYPSWDEMVYNIELGGEPQWELDAVDLAPDGALAPDSSPFPDSPIHAGAGPSHSPYLAVPGASASHPVAVSEQVTSSLQSVPHSIPRQWGHRWDGVPQPSCKACAIPHLCPIRTTTLRRRRCRCQQSHGSIQIQ